MPNSLSTRPCPTRALGQSPLRWLADPPNRRLKAFDPWPQPQLAPELVRRSHPLADKLIVYARPGQEAAWKSLGYRCEGKIRGYFSDRSDCWLWCAYPEPNRGRPRNPETLQANLDIARAPGLRRLRALPEGYSSEAVDQGQIAEVVRLMQTVFPVYPSEISTEAIARVVAEQSSCFRLLRNDEGQCVAVASAELNRAQQNAEMTDCATRPDQRGRGLMAHLLRELESQVARRFRIHDLYSLARGPEPGINRVFARLGYVHSGSLVNNCRMPSGWETMNLWCKFTASY